MLANAKYHTGVFGFGVRGGLGYTPDAAMVERIFTHAQPMGQATNRDKGNLGYGHLYYGLVRALRPKHILVIGSGYGFSVVALGIGLRDNGQGQLTFVDPSGVKAGLSFGKDFLSNNSGSWNNNADVHARFAKFGIDKLVTHYKMFDYEFFPAYTKLGLPPTDLVLVDGNHSAKYAQYDVEQALKYIQRPGYLLLHDTNWFVEKIGLFAGPRSVAAKLQQMGFPVLNLGPGAGLSVVRVDHASPITKSGLGAFSFSSLSNWQMLVVGAGIGMGVLWLWQHSKAYK